MRSISTLITGSVISQIIGLVMVPILSRMYGPAAFGVLALFLSLSALVSIVASLRYELAIVLPETDHEAIRLKRGSNLLLMGTSALTLIVTVILVVMAGLPVWLLLLAASVFLAGESSILYFWFTRRRRYSVQSASRVVQAAVTAAAQVAFGAAGMPTAEGLIFGYVIGQLAGVAVLVAVDDSRRARPPHDAAAMRALLAKYKKMPMLNAPNAAVDAVRLNGINFAIGAVSVGVLGQFSMSWKLVQSPMALVAGAISQVFYERMARAKPGELSRIVRKVIWRGLALGIGPFTILAIVAPYFVPWFLGEEWHLAGLMAQALVPWLYLNIVTAPLSNVFLVTSRQGLMLGFSLVYMVTPITVLLIMGQNIVSAVWVMSVAMAVLLTGFILLAVAVARRFDKNGLGEATL